MNRAARILKMILLLLLSVCSMFLLGACLPLVWFINAAISLSDWTLYQMQATSGKFSMPPNPTRNELILYFIQNSTSSSSSSSLSSSSTEERHSKENGI